MRLLLTVMIITQIIPLITANAIFIPRVVIQAGYPRGFRAYVPDFPGMQYFAFNGQLNPINGPRRILRGIIRAPVNGYWIYQDDDCLLRTNDVVSYATHMVINRVPYKSPSVTWTCPEPSQFVDFKAPLPPVRKPPTSSEPKPTDGSVSPELRNIFSPPPPEISTPSIATESKTDSPVSSPNSQVNQTTPTSTSSTTVPLTTVATPTRSQSTPIQETISNSSQSTPPKETSPSSTLTTPTADSTPSSPQSTLSEGTSSPSTQTTSTTETPSSSSESTPSTPSPPSNQTSTSPDETKTTKEVNTTPQSDKTSEQTTESTEPTKQSTSAVTTSEKFTEPLSTPSEPTEPSSEPTLAETSPVTTTLKSPVLDRRSDEPTDATLTDDQQTPKSENNSESTTPSMYIPVSEQPEEPNDENQPLFPGPFKPMMPPKGPSFEICSNPWNFVPRENETKTQKLEKQVAKLQCDLALFQRKFMQLGQVLEGELTDIKKLNTGVASRMSKLESVLKAASDA